MITAPTLSPAELARLATLQPHIQRLFRGLRLYLLEKQNVRIYLTSGTRTFDEQAKIYAQGRTAPGPIVTKARPGQSWHNFGLSFDVAIMIGNTLRWEIPPVVGRAGSHFGLEWGGDWKSFKDENHFQKIDGMTLAAASQKWPQGWTGNKLALS